MRPREAPERAEYALEYGRPRPSADSDGVIYERACIRVDHTSDEPAIRWAREVAPWELGMTHRGEPFLAAPILLRQDRMLIWESQAGVALRLIG
jgi:hypothetical protein